MAHSSGTPRKGPAWVKLGAFALALVGLAAVWRYTPLAELVTVERVNDWAEALGDMRWAPLAVLLVYVPASFVMFPRPLITLAAVIALGPWLGFVCAFSGIMLAAFTSYYLGRALPRQKVRQIAGTKLDAIGQALRKRGLIAVLAVRIVPVAPFIVVGIIAGALRIKLWHFALGTAIGLLPGTLTTTVFGEQLTAALEDPSSINYWLVAGVVLAFAVVMYVMRRWITKQNVVPIHS